MYPGLTRYNPPAGDTYDYIVAGGGAAGCVVAAGLAQGGRYSVLLIEGGRKDISPWIHITGTFFKALQTRDANIVRSEPEPGLLGAQMPVPQGTVLGGGSSVNAMCYVRGQREDYESWQAGGASGWHFENVLAMFKKQEKNLRLGDPFHGQYGPLVVGDQEYGHPANHLFIAAAQEAGYRHNTDFNGAVQEGIGFYQVTANRGRRRSAAASFLAPVAKNQNLHVAFETRVERVVFTGRRASAIEARDHSGVQKTWRARKEIVLTAGAFNSPKILMLSGVGPADELQRHGIDTVAHSEGVGANYQDHVATQIAILFKKPMGLHGQDKGLKALRHGLEYMFLRRGLLTSNIIEAGGFVDSEGVGRPDLQLNCTAMVAAEPGKGYLPVHGMNINPYILRPFSRGRVGLRSKNASDQIKLSANVLSDPRDVGTLRRGVQVARKIFAHKHLFDVAQVEMIPGPGVSDGRGSNEIDEIIRKNARTVFHPSGTCKIGEDDMAVVDPQLRVRGVEGLRVADASTMPTVTSGNTNAPTMMIAGRCVEFMLADA
ncbi:MAG: GMC family oxidoreductase [Alphaproteobacteria bacterium]|nr:GMC family oxidoreductase [Alphaproteobacteria bacterium]